MPRRYAATNQKPAGQRIGYRREDVGQAQQLGVGAKVRGHAGSVANPACAEKVFHYSCREDNGESAMEELTCPNCNVDVDEEELKRNNLRCPTCGFDMSESREKDDMDDADLEDEEDEFADDKDEDEDEEEDEE